MNGFPQWLTDLAKHHPLAVRDILTECIRGEWKFDAKRENTHEVLSRLSWSGREFLPIVKGSIIAQIRSGDPPNTSILETALTVLLKDFDSTTIILAQIAVERIMQYSKDSPGFFLWLPVWLQLDAGPALEYLQKILSKTPDDDNLMIRLCETLHGDPRQRISSVSSPDYIKPIHLRTFIPLIYRYIRPLEDLKHDGGFSPTPRDDAERFRNRLLERLSQAGKCRS